MYNFSNEAKTRIIEGKIIRAYLRVLATDTLPEIRINEENYLKDIQFEDFRYVPDEGIIGGTVAKKVIVNFVNVDETFSIQDREFELYIGVELEDETMEYQKYGTFIVQKPENDQVNDNTYCEALDYMIKFNEPYVDRMTYPCTLKQLFNDVVSQAGMQVGTTSFLNDSFIVEDNQFEEGTTLRDVLKAIAQVAFNWIAIDENNQVVMDFEMKNTIDETLDIDNYFDFSKQEQYGPINVITFKESQIQGQEVSISDSESISEYGENELAIVDNPFAYTQAKKQQLIQAGSNLFGFKYIPVSLNSIGYIYLNRKDKIKLINLNEQEFETYIFNHTIRYDGVALDSIESPAETKNESKYEFKSVEDLNERTKRTEIIVDKQNQQIEGVINNVEEQDEKIAQVLLTVDELNTKISDVANTTVSAESENANISLENVNASEPIQIKVHPINTNISYLYPRNNLYPSNSLYSTNRKIRFTNDTTNEYVDYKLPDDLLYYNSNIYDEFLLDYENNICRVTKRCGYNADGTVYALANEIITDYTYPTISLTDGDYTISLLGYNNGYIFAKLMVSNIYTTQFATRVEMNSAITQKANEINLNVNEKLDEEDFTSANIMLMINNDESQVQINADKISLVGKTFNLGADNITISSNNFNVDTNGNIIATNATISGTITAASGTIGGFTIATNKLYKDKTTLTSNTTGVYIGTDGIALGTGSTFKVTNTGALTCSNATITNGDITLISSDITTSKLRIRLSNSTYTEFSPGWIKMYNNNSLKFVASPTLIGFTDNSGNSSSMAGNIIGVQNSSGSTSVTLYSNGKIETTGNIDCGGTLYVNNASIQSTHTYSATTGKAPNLVVQDTGNFRRSTSSSKRYKKNITKKIEERLNPKKLYDLDIKQFKYKNNYLDKDDRRFNENILGFIVEDLVNIYEPAVDYNTDGTPEMWNYKVLIPAMLKLIQEQHTEIEQMKKEIEKLKGGK